MTETRTESTSRATRGSSKKRATGKSRAGLARALESLNLTNQFDASRCADETEAKPHPKMLLELAEVKKFWLRPKCCAYAQ